MLFLCLLSLLIAIPCWLVIANPVRAERFKFLCFPICIFTPIAVFSAIFQLWSIVEYNETLNWMRSDQVTLSVRLENTDDLSKKELEKLHDDVFHYNYALTCIEVEKEKMGIFSWHLFWNMSEFEYLENVEVEYYDEFN